jgi:Protein of unknown function (DUF3010)
MKTLGITLEANKAIFCALERSTNGSIHECSNTVKKLELKDHMDSKEVRSLREEIHAFLEKEKFDTIGIIKRGTKGRFAASPISFKIEGLIQTFPKAEIEFIAPATLNAFFKKKDKSIEPKYAYQKDACDLAFYLLR